MSRGLGGFISRVFGLFGKLGCPEFCSKMAFLDEAFGFFGIFWEPRKSSQNAHFYAICVTLAHFWQFRMLRTRILYAISRVRAQFGWPRIASETHFVRYLLNARLVWVALHRFGSAFLTLFA